MKYFFFHDYSITNCAQLVKRQYLYSKSSKRRGEGQGGGGGSQQGFPPPDGLAFKFTKMTSSPILQILLYGIKMSEQFLKIEKKDLLPGTIKPRILLVRTSKTRSMILPSNLPSKTFITSLFLSSKKEVSKTFLPMLYFLLCKIN